MAEGEICECGILVKGSSKDHLKTNMKSHKRGKKHREVIEFKKENGD